MATDITRDFTTTGRVTNMNCVLQIKSRCQFGQIVGVCIEIVSVPWLAGSPVAATIVCNAPIASLRQKEHLVFECVRTQRPTVAKDNGLSFTPILVIDLGSVFCRDCAH